MSGFVLGVDPTRVDTSAKFQVGSRGTDHLGREFIYVSFDEDTDTGEVAIIHEDSAAEPLETTESAAGTGQGKKCGVPLTDFVATEFGWLCVYSNADGDDAVQVMAGASCAAFTLLNTTGTDGTLDDDASTGAEEVPGIVITTAASGGGPELENALVNYPYVGLTIPA